MGRIADALQRALETEPDDSGLPAGDLPSKKDGGPRWYGAARSEFNTLEAELPAQAPDGPPVEGLSPDIVTYYDPSSVISEQYRSLRTRLLSGNPHQEHRIYAVSSAVAREGKSMTTVNLGFILAEIRHLRILIVDGDFRKGTLGRTLNAESTPGLADLLRNDATYEQIIHRTPTSNLFFIPSGRTHGRSAPELLSTHAARATFRKFERDFHYTIVDTPPASSVTDVGVIGQMTSGVIFVIRMHRTPEPLARRAIKLLQGNNIPIVGGLVIGEDDPSTGYGRRYHYQPEAYDVKTRE